MSENRNPRGGGKGISLNDIIWFIASRWRKIIVITLAAAVLTGGFTAVSYAVKLRDRDYLDSAKAANAQQAAAYRQEHDRLSAMQSHLKSQLEYQSAYAASPLFGIDPYAVHTIRTVYYITMDDPEDAGYSLAALTAYSAKLNQIDTTEFAAEGSDPGSGGADYGLSDLFISVALPDATSYTAAMSNTMRVTVIGTSAQQAEALQAMVDNAVEDAYTEVAGTVAPHKLTKISESLILTENEDLVQMHKDFESRLKTARDEYDDVTSELKKLKSPAKLVLTARAAASDTVKKAVLGGAAGLILALAYLFLYVDLRGRILSADDLTDNVPVDFLGSLNADPGRGKLDSFIARQLGLLPGKTREQELNFIAANLTRTGAPAASAALVGGAEPGLIGALARDLEPLAGGMKLVPGGDLLSSAEALQAYRDSEAVIFVETIDRSGRNSAARAYDMAAADGKKILGAVLTGETRK